ncbi:XRE family transcriptional regulator [Rhizocola hellebori]|uniref:XRE family transcriptional regulator n=1 Tax=Rhizocola hellebori TaxID=1392758 RepID=A0A8J3VF29_9ACTN|nr:BTAD domain-containing putative transcriptional regulator [Rhizocola hellebori]GIH03851.1 XRE family transcriptional regulator [Rhizocola hellebori]
MTEFRLLGSVEVIHADSVLALGGPRHRRLLATLLLQAGRVVPSGTLIEALWEDAPPRKARAVLQVRISELRAALRATGSQLLAREGGYELRVDSEDVDAWRFERLASAGAAALAAGDAVAARAELEAALALWRGPMLAEFAGEPFARSDTARLEELRWQAIHHRIAADLDLGHHAEIIAELEKLVVEQPLREQFRGQLMLALYRSGRQGEALEAFQAARNHLADQLGVDPGAELQALHHAMLTADPGLNPPIRSHVPAQLPADVTAFTGRAKELSWLDSLVAGSPSTVVISAVSGTAGVGKTALALRWAHRIRHRFPDGQLYADLRGYDPDLPVPPGEALARFLRALGIPERAIPVDVQERAALYRTALDGRRMLVVLDNASSASQIHELLPGTKSCMALITSRDSLSGLVARHGAHRLDLGLLTAQDAVVLLRRLIGARVDAEPQAAQELANLSARLPLALRITAELAAERAGSSLADIAAELNDHQRRWELLDAGGDDRTALRAVFSWSYQRLPAPAARLFSLLGLHPGAEFSIDAVAALAGIPAGAVRPVLETLARAHLVERTGPDRFGMHDLLRGYARHLFDAEAGEPELHLPLDRLFAHYLGMTATGDQAWLDAECANLIAVVACAAAHGWQDYATRMAVDLWPHLDAAGHYAQALAIHEHALRAARQQGDAASEHQILCNLGHVHMRLGRYPQAEAHLQRAAKVGRALGANGDAVQAAVMALWGLTRMWQGHYAEAEQRLRRGHTLSRAAGDRAMEAKALAGLGHVYMRQCRYEAAADKLRQAQAMHRECGDSLSEARALGNLAQICLRQHRLDSAAEHLERALDLFRKAGHRRDEAAAINALGEIYLRQGQHDRALQHHRQALATYRELGDRGNEGIALHGIGDAHLRRGEHEAAGLALRQALAVFHQVGDRPREVLARNTLGETLRDIGDLHAARAQHTLALSQANDVGDLFEQGRAHAGLADIGRRWQDTESARHHYQQALARYSELGLPEADELRDQLAKL